MTDANAALRQLVGDYYHGLLTFESYREQRGRLLDSLEGEGLDLEPSPDATARRRVPQLDSVVTEPGPEPALEPEPAVEAPKRRGGAGRSLGIAAGVALVAAVAVGVVMFRGGAPEGPGSADAPSLAGPSSAGETMLEQFLARNDWDEDSRNNFALAWNALSDAQRDEANASSAFRRLGDALRRRLLEEEALGGARADGEFGALLAFASELSMPFAAEFESRLSEPDEPAPAAAADAPDSTEPPTAAEAEASPATLAAESEVPPEGRADAETSSDELVADADAAPDTGIESDPAEAAAAASSDAAQATDAESSDGAQDPAVGEPPVVEVARAAPAVESNAQADADGAAPGGAAAAGDAAASASETDGDPCRAELASTRRPYCQDLLAEGGTAPGLVILPAGRFTMGSDERPEEGPPHEVTIARAFAMSVYEVSHAEFAAYCAATGRACPERAWNDDDAPVVLVTAEEADAYAAWLSEQTGRVYRLPTEAEWEYAARAGTDTPYFFGDVITPSWARSSANVPVDGPLARDDESMNRNPFRLFHMAGNVREWVADHWQNSYAGAPVDGSARRGGDASRRVVRGGSYADPGYKLRSAAREGLDATARDRQTGFRIVRELER